MHQTHSKRADFAMLIFVWSLLVMMAVTAPTSRRVSKRRAALHAGCDRDTLENFIEATGLTVYRLGQKTFRIDLDELDEAMRTYGQEEVTAAD